MTIGTYNIFTSFWFLFMLICSGTLTYFSFNNNVFLSDLFLFSKVIMGFIMLVFTGLLISILMKFRVLFISHKRLISIFPFLLKKEIIDLTNVKKIHYENILSFKGTVFRKLIIFDSHKSLSFSDLEFENFDLLLDKLHHRNLDRKVVDLKQAKSNISDVNFNVYLLVGLIGFLVLNIVFSSSFHFVILTFLVCNGILLYASIKRKRKYDQILKENENVL